MIMKKIQEIFEALIFQGHIARSTLIGCGADELLIIENFFGYPLPQSYRDFLSIAGKGAGKLFQGTDIFYPRVLDLKSEAKELLLEVKLENLLPDDAMVFCMHQGYELNYFVTGSDDPSIMQYVEGEMQVVMPWKTFSEFISTSIQNHLTQWSDLN
jgi:SMI1-KNR4 cell-wall